MNGCQTWNFHLRIKGKCRWPGVRSPKPGRWTWSRLIGKKKGIPVSWVLTFNHRYYSFCKIWREVGTPTLPTLLPTSPYMCFSQKLRVFSTWAIPFFCWNWTKLGTFSSKSEYGTKQYIFYLLRYRNSQSALVLSICSLSPPPSLTTGKRSPMTGGRLWWPVGGVRTPSKS